MKNSTYAFLLLLAIVGFLSSCDNDEEPKKEPVVTTSNPSNITFTSATAGGTVTDDGNDNLIKTGVVYSSNVAMPTTADNKAEATTAIEGAFTIELTGLSSGTTYHVRAFATNGVGTSYGDVIDFSTGNAAPTVTNVLITGTLEVGKTVTASYTYQDSENNPEGATTIKWYVADNATGGGEVAIADATTKEFTIGDAQNGKFLRVAVTPHATTGTTTGAEVKSAYSTAIGAETVTFIYDGATVTYGTILGSAGKKWLDRNLGALRAAQSLTDYEAYGDYFQWGRAADGHQLIIRSGGTNEQASGKTGQTSSAAPYATSEDPTPETNQFIVVNNVVRDWQNPQNTNVWQGVNGVNNPCPTGWRIPTRDEWSAEFPVLSPTEAFDKLKLPYTGYRSNEGIITSSGAQGFFWSSTPHATNGRSYYASFYVDGDASYHAPRAYGYTCRCVKE